MPCVHRSVPLSTHLSPLLAALPPAAGQHQAGPKATPAAQGAVAEPHRFVLSCLVLTHNIAILLHATALHKVIQAFLWRI